MVKQIGKTLYQFDMPCGDKVEVGDKESVDFKPHIKLNRWDGECFIKVQMAGDIEGEVEYELVDDKLKTKYKIKYGDFEQEVEAEFYPLAPTEQFKLGGFEFEVILKEKPSSNEIVFDIETQWLKFYYQPALTLEEIAEGCIRPDNVVGSYAVYHATRTNMHRGKAEAEKYKVGKAFHIYRPKVIDADGVWIWADLLLDEPDGKLIITINQSWLDSAVYPITVDPNFGHESSGASSEDFQDKIGGWGGTPSSAGIADSITAYITSYDAGDKAKAALYKDSDASLLSPQSEEKTGPYEDGWQTFDITSGPSLTTVKHYITVWADSSMVLRLDTGGSGHAYDTETYGAYPDPWAQSPSSYIRSIYCTYTPSDGAVTVTPITLALTLTEYASILKEKLTPTTLALTTASFAPILKEILTPSTLALVIAGYIPVIIVPTVHRNVADDFWDWSYEPPIRVTITPLPDEIQFKEKE